MQTLKVRATLKPATIADIFHGRDTYMNKLLFVKCPINGDFKGIYTIPELDNNLYPYHTYQELEKRNASNRYYKKEIFNGLATQIFYVLSDSHNEYDYQFKLQLRTADFFDLFISEKSTKANTLYYVRVNDQQITGPHYLPKETDINHLKNAMNTGKIFVPTSNQTFEPYKIAKAS
jgi:hypothetical protein